MRRNVRPKSLFIPPPTDPLEPRLPTGPLKRLDPQRLFSKNALRRAWSKVKAVGGAPGVDRVSLEQFEADLGQNLGRLRKDLLAGRYKPQPVKRFLIPKPNGNFRSVALWTLRDKIVQRVVYDYIEPYFEAVFLDSSYGFRPGRSVGQAIKSVIDHRQAHRRWVVDLDIKDCFDAFDSKLMLRFVKQRVHDPTILGLVRAWLKAKVFNAPATTNGATGTSQGAVISPLLANAYLHQLDVQLTRRDYHLVRYADNLIICCRTKKEAEQALQTATHSLHRIKLEPNPHKTRIVHIDQGFKFLGYFFLRNEVFEL